MALRTSELKRWLWCLYIYNYHKLCQIWINSLLSLWFLLPELTSWRLLRLMMRIKGFTSFLTHFQLFSNFINPAIWSIWFWLNRQDELDSSIILIRNFSELGFLVMKLWLSMLNWWYIVIWVSIYSLQLSQTFINDEILSLKFIVKIRVVEASLRIGANIVFLFNVYYFVYLSCKASVWIWSSFFAIHEKRTAQTKIDSVFLWRHNWLHH